MSNILVTGSSGFIGSYVAEKYKDLGFNVYTLDLKEGIGLEDLNLLEYVRDNNIDTINHHAAQIDITGKNPVITSQNNIVNSVKLYEVARKANVKKIIYASSGGAIYGDQPCPICEDNKIDPCNSYGIEKMANEQYLKYYSDTYGIKVTILRYSNVYGARQVNFNSSCIIPTFIKKMLSNEPISIYGSGTNTRDYVYISDVVNANIIALGIEGTFNISTAKETSINDIYNILYSLIDYKGEKTYNIEKARAPYRNCLLYTKIQDKWQPKIDIETGLKLTVNWYKQYKENYDTQGHLLHMA
jgi:UDP-glucose 4-epimerase